MKKIIVTVGSLAMILWVGIGAYLVFFQSPDGGKIEPPQEETVKVEDQEKKTEPGQEPEPEPEPEKKAPPTEAPKIGGGLTSVITTVSEENDWRLDTPIDTLNFEDPKDRDKARRKISRDIKVSNRKALAVMKESTAEEKEKREQADALNEWLAKESHQNAIE